MERIINKHGKPVATITERQSRTEIHDRHGRLLGYCQNGKTYDKHGHLLANSEVPGLLIKEEL